jgi:uncharacterized protein YhfF
MQASNIERVVGAISQDVSMAFADSPMASQLSSLVTVGTTRASPSSVLSCECKVQTAAEADIILNSFRFLDSIMLYYH